MDNDEQLEAQSTQSTSSTPAPAAADSRNDDSQFKSLFDQLEERSMGCMDSAMAGLNASWEFASNQLQSLQSAGSDLLGAVNEQLKPEEQLTILWDQGGAAFATVTKFVQDTVEEGWGLMQGGASTTPTTTSSSDSATDSVISTDRADSAIDKNNKTETSKAKIS